MTIRDDIEALKLVHRGHAALYLRTIAAIARLRGTRGDEDAPDRSDARA